ncbi:MAG: ABC transporter substrate-binding protein [Kiritimatiellaeota bacterium]|nr:ABC transporter substrate-binding protein [Kiritimatiellota bacterium]
MLAGLLTCTGCGRGRLDAGERPGEMVAYRQIYRIRTLDPAQASDVYAALEVAKTYETLLQYNYLDRPYHVEPLLATAMPEISPDGLTYTFKVRPGIFFQDDPCFKKTGGKGREVVAADFAYSMRRVMDIKNASNGSWCFSQVVGMEEWRATTSGEKPTDYDAPIAGLQTPDTRTIVIRLKQPQPQLVWILAMHYAAAVAREAVECYGKELGHHPVGTGAFILKSFRPNYRYEFIRNPKWRETKRVELFPVSHDPNDPPDVRAAAGKQIPFLDRIVEYVVEDQATAWLMFLTGQVDASPVARDNFSVVMGPNRSLSPDLQRQGICMAAAPTMDTFYMGFNFDDPVVGPNKKLRQALCYAFNEVGYNQFYNDRITRPTGPLPPGVAGYVARPQPYPLDLPRAKKLLAEAGYPDGLDPKTGRRLQLTMELGSADDAEYRQSIELFCNFMDKLGIKIIANFHNWPAFQEKLERRQAQLFHLAWSADYPDAENYLQLFYSRNCSPGPNHSNYINKEFDKLYEKARVMTDSPERTALYTQMANIVIEDCVWLMTMQPFDYVMRHGWMGNYKYHDFPYGMIKYYSVDPAVRHAWLQQHGR